MPDLLSGQQQATHTVVPATQTDRATRFGVLIAAELDESYRLATVILAGDRSEAEDAVHDAGLRAWEHFDELRDPARFEAWFTRIVVNSCRDRLKRRRVRPIEMDAFPAHTASHADAVIAADTLERALFALSPEHRAVVALRYLGDWTVNEIAARTGERTGTVKSRLHYAVRSLRAALDAESREAIR